MDTIACGGATVALRVDNDGIGTALFRGLLVPGNFVAMGALTMRVGVARGARGLLYRNDLAAICCDPSSMSAGYATLVPPLRGLPVAFVVNAGQAQLYEGLVQRAGAAGLMRKMFHDPLEAREWLAQTLQLLDDNSSWWATRP